MVSLFMTGMQDHKILVTGGSGQLATSLQRLAPHNVHVVGRPEFDFDRPETLLTTLTHHQPKLVVNAAAWTAVDLAESHPEAAYAANKSGPAILADFCHKAGIPFIHISTDYVFNGDKGAPYLESDPISPTTVYGRSKAEGEAAVLAACPTSVILRTSWVYAPHGKNFVKTMVAAGAKHTHLKVVADQHGNPTNADDLALVILKIAEHLLKTGPTLKTGGLYHAAGQGETSWHGLAVAAFEEAAKFGQAPPQEVTPILTSDWPTPARRPQDSRLNCQKLEQTFGLQLPDWRSSLVRAVSEMFS